MRKQFCDQLNDNLVQTEAIYNSVFNQQMEQKISQHNLQFLSEQFKMLNEAMENI